MRSKIQELLGWKDGGTAKEDYEKRYRHYKALRMQGYEHGKACIMLNTGVLKPISARSLERYRARYNKEMGISLYGARPGAGRKRKSNPQAIAGLQFEKESNPQAIAGLQFEKESNPQAIAGLQFEKESNPQAIAGLQFEKESNPQAAIDNILYNKNIDNGNIACGFEKTNQSAKEIIVPSIEEILADIPLNSLEEFRPWLEKKYGLIPYESIPEDKRWVRLDDLDLEWFKSLPTLWAELDKCILENAKAIRGSKDTNLIKRLKFLQSITPETIVEKYRGIDLECIKRELGFISIPFEDLFQTNTPNFDTLFGSGNETAAQKYINRQQENMYAWAS